MMEGETAVWMRRLAELSRNEDALPDPAVIWWRARLLDRREAQARATRPIAIAQWVSLVVAVVGVIVLCAVYSAGIEGMIAPVGLAVWVGLGACFVLTVAALRHLFAHGRGTPS